MNPLFLLLFYFTAKAKTHREIDRKLKHLREGAKVFCFEKTKRESVRERGR